MRIGIEAQRIFREKKHGMDIVAIEMIKALQKLDAENEYVVYTNEGPDVDVLPKAPNFKLVTFGASYPIWEQVLLPKHAEADRLDILHCTGNTAPIRLKTTLVITLHDIIYFERNPLLTQGYSLYQRWGNVYRRFVVGRLLNKARKIITVSEFERQRFLDRLSLDPNRLQVIYNGVGEHFREIEDAEHLERVRKKYDLPKRFAFFLGNTDPKKNTNNTLLAFAQHAEKDKDLHLVIADVAPDVKQILGPERFEMLQHRIHALPYVPQGEMPALFNLAQVFLYTSKRESFGIPILESMACGTPVITSNVSSMPEVAGNAALLVDPFQVSSISDGLSRLLQEPDLYEHLTAEGKKRVQAFSWMKNAEKTLHLYREIVS